ncbi:hypothetical protein GCK72_008463 [Caenorhabditis remanei]|uniref:Protein arginine N-methyltransferase n=1 Tax=Caenorhabditis remanei TaxID=31234 RepID=A0A6A5GYR7_CAERE|nr:hypothetical protein GCK72_008463 [Caenorhabditis remanei]KAF1760217.1 hypothetical protein GCK72_008463 [Caenorhabditis remanei]
MSGRTYADDLFPLKTDHPDEHMSVSTTSTPSSPNSVDAANSRIHVGWMTTPMDVVEDLDRNVAPYCTKLGEFKYNFVVFPVGGVVRAYWKPVEGNEKHPPVIDLPDVQLGNNLWESYVTGKISPWIDCDSPDTDFAALSEEHLIKELNYICYLGLQSMTIELKRISSPKTAAIMNKWLWTKNSRFIVWVQLPSSVEICADYDYFSSSHVDLWTIWADFRKQCNNFSGVYLQVVLTISADLPDEFMEEKLVNRWKAEPLAAFVVETSAFGTARSGEAALPNSHISLLKYLWTSDSLRLVLRATTDTHKYNIQIKSEYSLALRQAVRDVHYKRQQELDEGSNDSSHSLNVGEYKDVLQAPLQPLSENLDSGVYNTFEQDKMKYDVYEAAVVGALKDLGADGRKTCVVYLLGGGRGPIGTKILRAEKEYNTTFRQGKDPLKVKLYIVEKNTNAIVTLKFMNSRSWKRRVTIVESDMRSLPGIARDRGFEQPDIIVSELLGSFGDNELSPECLDGVTDFLKPTTISIPQKYTSYVKPIMSTHIHQTIKAQSIPYLSRALPCHGRGEPELEEDGSWVQKFPQGNVVSNMDQIYVVYLSKYIPLAESTKPVFSFEHPNFLKKSNERSEIIEFVMDRNADLMGFGGYFDLQLYKTVMLSIEPSTQTAGMLSWFPAVIPLRDQLRVAEGDTIRLKIDRKIDEGGVWYEWRVELKKPNGEVTSTPLQNSNGESYYMRM